MHKGVFAARYRFPRDSLCRIARNTGNPDHSHDVVLI
jgi:hypothetical protein